MESVGPPKFKAFQKTRVTLALETTPTQTEQTTDITANPMTAFRDATGQGPDTEIQGPAADEVTAVSEPGMFKKKAPKQSKKTPAAVIPGTPAAVAAFPALLTRVTKKKVKAPGAPQVYSRIDVVSRDLQDAEVAKLPTELKAIATGLLDIEKSSPYSVEPEDFQLRMGKDKAGKVQRESAPGVFVPTTRRGFGSFLVDNYGPIFPKAADRELDVAKCAAKGDEGTKEVKIYHYQAFIREYLRYESPYRGLLVYHGLGSGKTCSAIAAAEALFGTRGLKVIVMTPFSLRDNFISEISFCGFKHFRLQNHWSPLSMLPGSNPEPGMVKLFAQNVYGIPESFFSKRARGRPQLSRIWIPDFDKEPNFDSLGPEEKDEIQTQLKATIENRIKFINYNGITARELKTMVCSTPDAFDNSVIVVDEIHNLTRLIQGSLEPYLGTPTGRRRTTPVETLTPDRKKLPLCGMTKNYMRGYLFYRLFMDAKNTKIIGLSGTPLINFPEELGILMNILHGPIHTIEFIANVEGMRDIRAIIEKAVDMDENLDTVFFEASTEGMIVTMTRLPEQFTKVLADDSEVLGIRRRDPGKPAPSLEQVWTEFQKVLKAEKITIKNPIDKNKNKKNFLSASELLPSWDTPFRGAFLEEDGITLKRTTVLQKRIRGLVSYYRGIQGDVMPKVIKDEIVGVPLAGYSLKIYNKLRNQEIQVEMSKPKDAGKGDVWAEIGEIAAMKTPSNYRMSSRQACNFVFTESVIRPRPRNLEEQDTETGKDRDVILDADVEGKVAGHDEGEDEMAVELENQAIEKELQADLEAVGEKPATTVAVIGTREQAEAYRKAIKSSKEKLRQMGPTHLKLDGPPESNLAKYSPKFASMLSKINELGGSSLVYSQFLEMEGIGIFGICMEANGFVPIEIVPGADGKLKFSERSAASLLKGPKAKEMRYIEFTGTGSKEQRGAAVNVFNARLDKLPPAMEKVLKDGGWTNNFDGGLCRVFCITSAGAEGLSLKCVRGVHIMEPYWNTVRTQQVKGRAVRICSHMDLPVDQQNVEIYTYCTIIPEEAILAQAVDKTLERSDSYSAKDAAALGVPVPMAATGEIPEGLFLKVDAEVEPEVAPGAQATVSGPIRFFAKLDNEYRGFSNFAPSATVIDGKRYPSLEHYFQSMKFPADTMWQEAIRVAPTPVKARQLGTQPDHPIRSDWDSVKESIMLTGLRAKFQQNRGLLELLKATGSRPLIEASPGDTYWGEGRSGRGKNRMGKLLEQVREELREYVLPVEEATSPDVAATGALAAAAANSVVEEEFFEGEIPEAETEAMAAPMPVAEPVAQAEPVAEPVAMPEPVANEQVSNENLDAIRHSIHEGGMQTGGDGEDRTIILTSDQKVLLISLRKEKVIGSLQTIMKTVAVDCLMNFQDNNDGSYMCLGLGDSIGDFAYHPDLEKDINETEARFKKRGDEAKPLFVAPVATVMALPNPLATLAKAPVAPVASVAAEASEAPVAAEAPVAEASEAPVHAEAPVAEAPVAPVAAPAVAEAPVAAAVEPVKPKLKRIMYRKTLYMYEAKLDETGKPLGYMLYNPENQEVPVGYVVANPKTKLPVGDIQPVPV